MTVIQAAWLGVVQGLTEFLPISSSAHLILVRSLFGWDAGSVEIAFDVACHLGTLFAVVIYLRGDVARLLASVPHLVTGRGGEAARLGRLLVIATVPIALAGALFGEVIERIREPLVAAAALSGGALLMLATERVARRQRDAGSLSLAEAFGLGCAQAVALIPGVSRSGAVITVGMLRGLTRPEAARFSFLLGIPAILAAGVRTGWMLDADALTGNGAVLLVGFLTSGVVGYLAVAGLIRYLARHPIDLFAYYRLLVAVALGAWWLVA